MMVKRLFITAAFLLNVPSLSFAQHRCEDIFKSNRDLLSKNVVADKSHKTPPPRSTQEAWQESVSALSQINHSVVGRTQVIESLAAAMLAHEFVWINGEPGGAKTSLSRLIFQ